MRLSVIIPTHNRAPLLSRLLDSLPQDPVPFDWEIVVVDNNSSDLTPKVVKRFQGFSAISIRYFLEPRIGLVYGRHRGAEESKGEILGYLDDDMHVSPTWLLGHEKIFRAPSGRGGGTHSPQSERLILPLG